jgi:ribosome recycling factor
MLDDLLNDIKKKMDGTINAMKKELGTIRTGRASLSILDNIKIAYYDSLVSINQVASLSIPEGNLILIRPWEAVMLKEIVRAISSSDLGINPIDDGKVIKLPIPALTEERRKELAKRVWKIAEECKTSLRMIRREAIEKTKKAEKDKQISEDDSKRYQDKIQKITDEFNTKIQQAAESKEKEITSL